MRQVQMSPNRMKLPTEEQQPKGSLSATNSAKFVPFCGEMRQTKSKSIFQQRLA